MSTETGKISSAYDIGKLEAHPPASEANKGYNEEPPWCIAISQHIATFDSAKFRRFSDLNMLNLIYLQSKLLKLRRKFYSNLSDTTED
jgi:hypothetical protein